MDYDETDTCWHLMVRTRGGKVSMMQNLDAPTARQAYRCLRPDQWPVKYINQEGLSSWSVGGWSQCHDSDIESVEIMGPEGAKLEPWRGVEPRIIDLAPERERQIAAKELAEVQHKRAEERAVGVGALNELQPTLSGSFRCAECNTMQPNDSLLFYLPDGVRKGDDVEAIREQVKRSIFNGHSSGWCARCVPKEPDAQASGDHPQGLILRT